MKKHSANSYTLLTSENTQLNQPDQPQKPSVLWSYLLSLLFFIGRFILILLGLFISINRLANFISTGQLSSLAFVLVGLVFLGLGVGKAFRVKAFSSLRKIIHFLSGVFGLLLQAGFLNTLLDGNSSKALICLTVGGSLLLISYLTRNPKKVNQKKTGSVPQEKPVEDDVLFDSETLNELLPEIITDLLNQENRQATCTKVHSIKYHDEEPISAVAVTSTGQEFQIDMSISEEGGLTIKIPEDFISHHVSQ